MTTKLTSAGYEQTKAKLQRLEVRYRALMQRRDLSATHLAEARRSYEQMMGQYRQEMRLYEARLDELDSVETGAAGAALNN